MKQFMRIILLCLFVLLINPAFATADDYIKLLSKLNTQFYTTCCLQKNLYVTGEGGGLMENVRLVVLPFETIQDLSLEQARSLFIEVAETYLALVNKNTSIRPFLNNYPFTINNLRLTIGIRDKNCEFQKDGKIALILYIKEKGFIYYDTYNSVSKRFETLYLEPYEEALKLVAGG